MTTVVLHQFPYSHFNDKARWALAHKQVEYQRRDYLPGPHVPALRRLSGQAQTPVLCWDDVVVAGSAAIIDFLEQRVPDPPLYPDAADQRRAALELAGRADASLGPAARAALFSILVDHADYFCALFCAGRPRLVRTAYRLGYPLARPLIARGNGITSATAVRDAFATVEQWLDEVATRTAASSYLVGERFGVADLTVAALLSPLFDPPVRDMARPRPWPPAMVAFMARWQDHPALTWAAGIYARHGARPAA